jgi:hypothetical protein
VSLYIGYIIAVNQLPVTNAIRAKSEKRVVDNEVNSWFNWAQSNRIVIAMTNGWVYTPKQEAVKIEEMMTMYPLRE